MSAASVQFDWPHAPVHRLGHAGAFIVTAGTYGRDAFFAGSDRLNFLTSTLLTLSRQYGWRLQAWAVFANHYHFVADTEQPSSLREFLRHLHSVSAKRVNYLDQVPGRRVWHQYWDTHLTYHKSFLARLNYVHTNLVKHGVVANADLYPWCSAAWFARTATGAFHATVMSFRSNQVVVPDEYEVTKNAVGA